MDADAVSLTDYVKRLGVLLNTLLHFEMEVDFMMSAFFTLCLGYTIFGGSTLRGCF